jgi:hypothetical protein
VQGDAEEQEKHQYHTEQRAIKRIAWRTASPLKRAQRQNQEEGDVHLYINATNLCDSERPTHCVLPLKRANAAHSMDKDLTGQALHFIREGDQAARSYQSHSKAGASSGSGLAHRHLFWTRIVHI